jgi:hypothetical protein
VAVHTSQERARLLGNCLAHGNLFLDPNPGSGVLSEVLPDLQKNPNMQSIMGICSRTMAEKEFSMELAISQTFMLRVYPKIREKFVF